jgi:hypothetical protein
VAGGLAAGLAGGAAGPQTFKPAYVRDRLGYQGYCARVTRTGLIGAGRMGLPMRANLVRAGYEVNAGDARPRLRRQRLPSRGGGIPEHGTDQAHCVVQVGSAGDGQCPGRRRRRLAGEPVPVDGVLVTVRRSGVQDFQFLAAVLIGDHRHGQVRVGGEFGGQVTQRSRSKAGSLVPDLPGAAPLRMTLLMVIMPVPLPRTGAGLSGRRCLLSAPEAAQPAAPTATGSGLPADGAGMAQWARRDSFITERLPRSYSRAARRRNRFGAIAPRTCRTRGQVRTCCLVLVPNGQRPSGERRACRRENVAMGPDARQGQYERVADAIARDRHAHAGCFAPACCTGARRASVRNGPIAETAAAPATDRTIQSV